VLLGGHVNLNLLRRTLNLQSQDRKITALISRPSHSDYARIAKQVREWSFRFDGAEKPLEFLEQVEWSANTYGLDLDMIS